MAAIDWPTTLPAYISKNGFAQTLPANKIVSTVAVGPVKTRKRFTANVNQYVCTLLLSQSEKADFDTFYNDTTSSGVAYFNRQDPITESTIEMRFIGNPPTARAEGVKYRVSFQLEDRV
jgi:hypothetical protein